AEELALEEGVRGAAHDRNRRRAGLVHGSCAAAAVVRVLGLSAGAEVEPLAADGARQGGAVALSLGPRLGRAREVRLELGPLGQREHRHVRVEAWAVGRVADDAGEAL